MAESADSPRGQRASPRRRRRWGLLVVLVVFFLVCAAGAVGAVRYYNWCQEGGHPRHPVTITVPPGASGDDVVAILSEHGVIRCGGLVGRSLLQKTGREGEIRAGTYDLTTNITLDKALGIITKPPAPVKTVTITIPEGYRLTQIADVVSQHLGIPAAKFLDAANSGDHALPPYLPPGHDTTEGFLFPNTYEFAKGTTTPEDVVDKLLEQFGIEVKGLPWGNAKALGLSPYQVVIVASLIEREAAVASERPKIAAVIYNRLRSGEILGIDAALQYIDPDPSNGLTESDLHIDSPYNTRIHKGLPPTPIASPGLASIKAALEPADVPYHYYVLCGADGSHVFSTSYQQFLADKAQCLG
jgi:UPF0755 protein